jgi:hypothetical protein
MTDEELKAKYGARNVDVLRRVEAERHARGEKLKAEGILRAFFKPVTTYRINEENQVPPAESWMERGVTKDIYGKGKV